MTVKGVRMAASLLLLIPLILFVTPTGTLAVTPADADEWDSGRPIEIAIDSPPTNTYLPINKTQSLHADVRDCDEYRVDEEWYTYWDEVRSGNTSADRHVWWEATEGTWNDMFGVYATYKAPDYESGSSIRTVTITAEANDTDRGDETPTDAGYDDDDESDSITLKVWQIHVSGQITGTTSSNYDGIISMPTRYGGTDLGWVEHGNPSGATGYFGNIQLKGTKSSTLNITTGFGWYNYVKGIVRHKTTTSEPSWVTPYDFDEPNYILDFGPPGPPCVDNDMRHPNGGTDVSEIFALDAPGWDTGANNDKDIPPLTYYDFDCDYKAWVTYSGVRASNESLWGVGFELDEVSGAWSEVFHALSSGS